MINIIVRTICFQGHHKCWELTSLRSVAHRVFVVAQYVLAKKHLVTETANEGSMKSEKNTTKAL